MTLSKRTYETTGRLPKNSLIQYTIYWTKLSRKLFYGNGDVGDLGDPTYFNTLRQVEVDRRYVRLIGRLDLPIPQYFLL